MRKISTLFFIVAIFLTGLTSKASAAAITLNSSGGSSFQLIGSGFSSVAALNVTIKYDTSALEAPRVTQGPLANGTLFVANPNLPGEVRIAFVHTSGVSGSGSIAEITFTRRGNSAGGITSITAQTLDAKGKALPVTAALGNLSVASSDSGSPGSPLASGLGGTTTIIPGTQPSGTAGTGGTAYLGGVTLPGEGDSSREKQARESAEPPPGTPPAATPAESTLQESSPESRIPTVKKEKLPAPNPPANVLELFRTYQGEPKLKSLKKLFVDRGGEWIVQIPAVAPADGKTLVTLQLATDRFSENAPNFSLSGLEMKRVKASESGWAIEAVPAKDSLNSSISIVFDGQVVDVQVISVPALPKSWDKVRLTEAEVNRFLADRTSPKGDLNGDGRHDYKDDYILVGNYLLQETSSEQNKTEGGKKAN